MYIKNINEKHLKIKFEKLLVFINISIKFGWVFIFKSFWSSYNS